MIVIPGVFVAACNTPAAPAAHTSAPVRHRSFPPLHGERIVGEFGAWDVYARRYVVGDIPASRLTDLIYAFGAISPTGEASLGDQWADVQKPYPGDAAGPMALHGSFHQLQILKQKYPNLQTLVSFGGWNGSGKFSDVAAAPSTRRRFALSCIKLFLTTWPGVFDGIDLDWEYPVSGGKAGNLNRPQDKQNLTLLVQELRRDLDAQGKIDKRHYLLTVSAPAGPQNYAHLELKKIGAAVDWVNLMAYDFNTPASRLTGFVAPLFAAPGAPSSQTADNVDAAVRAYLAAGVPAGKIVLGAPCFGYGYADVPNQNHGLYQSHRKTAPPGGAAPGIFDYKDLKAHYIPVLPRFWQPQAKAPWLYSPTRKLFISYEDPESIGGKAAYVHKRQLGGIMLWELSQDDGSLLNSVYSEFQRPQN